MRSFSWRDLDCDSCEEIAEIVEELYDSEPVTRHEIAVILKVSPNVISGRLKRAHDRGLIANAGGRWGGWLPPDADYSRGPTKYERAAEAVAKLFEGEPVNRCRVAESLDIDKESATWLLQRAAKLSLVRRVGTTQSAGWVPVDVDFSLTTAPIRAVEAVDNLYCGSPVTLNDIATNLGVDNRIASKRLFRARQAGLVIRQSDGTGRGRGWIPASKTSRRKSKAAVA